MAVEGFEQASEEVGAEAGRHEGDNARMLGHRARMDDLPGDGRSKMGDRAPSPCAQGLSAPTGRGDWRVGSEFRFKLKFK